MNRFCLIWVILFFIFPNCKEENLENAKTFKFLDKEIEFPNYYEIYDRKKFEKEMGIRNFGPDFIHGSDLYLRDKDSSNFIRLTARRFNQTEKDFLENQKLFNLKYRLIESEQGNNLVWKTKFFKEENSHISFVYEFDYSQTYYCHIRKYVFKDYIINLSLFSTDRNSIKIDDFKKFQELHTNNSIFDNLSTSKMASDYLRDYFDM